MAYYRLEPFGEERADWRAAMLAATVVNLWRDPKKGRKAEIEDFMPRFGEEERGADTSALESKWTQIVGMMRGTNG